MEINSNSPNSSNSSSAPVGLGNIQRPGEYLRQIRLSQNKSLSDVASDLKIAEKQLLALESDDYAALPEAPFIKGYLRAYAKYLNTDLAALIQRFDENYKNETGLPAQHTLKDSPIKTMGRLSSSGRRGMNKWLKRGLWLLLLIILFVALFVGINHWMQKKQSSVLIESDSVENQVQQSQIQQSQVEQVPLAGTNNAQVTTAGGDQLLLEFSHPTSVMITDASGNTLAQGRQSTNLQLHGQAPFNIRIDDASAAKLKLNNEEINLSSHTNASGSASLSLSP